jgi:hypothetical protein
MYIDANGRGTADWPTHIWCDIGSAHVPSPCDKIVPEIAKMVDGISVPVEEIIDGGHATLHLISVSGSTAHAIVEGSTEQSALPDGSMTMIVTPQDMLDINTTARSVYGQSPLCGSRSSALSLSQQDARGISCGA